METIILRLSGWLIRLLWDVFILERLKYTIYCRHLNPPGISMVSEKVRGDSSWFQKSR